MKAITRFGAVALLVVCSLAIGQVNMPSPGAPGNSPDSAVPIVATSDLMVDRFIKRWLRQHYPGWDAEPHEFMEIGFQRYAVVYITSHDNPGRRIYFRVKNSMRDDDDGFPPM